MPGGAKEVGDDYTLLCAQCFLPEDVPAPCLARLVSVLRPGLSRAHPAKELGVGQEPATLLGMAVAAAGVVQGDEAPGTRVKVQSTGLTGGFNVGSCS